MLSSGAVGLVESKDRRTPLRVLLTGDNDSPSAPQRTLAKALARLGVTASFRPDLPCVSGHDWLREVRATDAIIHVEYAEPDSYSARQLAIAAAFGKAVVRWWVGTDVLLCVQNPTLQAKAALIQQVTTGAFASAPHLVEELASVGLDAKAIPPPLDEALPSASDIILDVPRAVLTYLPTWRLQFYGADIVRQVAAANSDLPFIVVGDESHSLRDLPNVKSLGWISDMQPIYTQIGCVLRMTEHDAIPRIIADALARGRYVIHRWPLTGCWLAKTAEEAHEKLKLFRAADGPNFYGAAAISQLYDPPPEVQFIELIEQSIRRTRLQRRTAASLTALQLTIEGRRKKKFAAASGAGA